VRGAQVRVCQVRWSSAYGFDTTINERQDLWRKDARTSPRYQDAEALELASACESQSEQTQSSWSLAQIVDGQSILKDFRSVSHGCSTPSFLQDAA
jgi:hypothetical protein